MKTMSETTETKTAYGKALDTAIPYTFTYEAYDDKAEFIAAKAELTVDEQMKVRNREALAKARSAALTAALTAAGHKKPTSEDPQVALREMVKTLTNVIDPKTGQKKFTEAKARELASMTLGIDWED